MHDGIGGGCNPFFATVIQKEDQSGNLISKIWTAVEDVDGDPTYGLVGDQYCIAGLASNNLCMLPWWMSSANGKCSVARRPTASAEPNDAQMPRCFSKCLAINFYLPSRGVSPDWMDDATS